MLKDEIKPNAVVSDTVGLPSSEYSAYMTELRLIHDLLGGTRVMRARGEEYLPKEEGETVNAYNARVKRTTLLSVMRRTGQKLSGEVFSDLIKRDGIKSEEMETFVDDVDQNGKSIDRFSRSVFEQGIYDGATHVLIDFPEIKTMDDGNIIRYFDDEEPDKNIAWKPFTDKVVKEKGWRPYWVHCPASSIIGWKTKREDGKTVLTQIRIREYSTEDDPNNTYATRTVERIRVLEPGKFGIWEKIVKEKSKTGSTAGEKQEWVQISSGETQIKDYIPLYTFMPGEEITDLSAESPLEGLSWLCLTHWQSTSEQRNILRYARFGIWFGKKLTTDEATDKVLFGAGRLVLGNESDSDLKAVEMEGKAIGAGERDLKDLETRMSIYGLSFLMAKPGGSVTATEKVIDSAESSCSLKSWAIDFNDFLNQLMYTTQVMYKGEEIEGDYDTVEVNKEFRTFLMDIEPKYLLEAADKNIIPKEVVFHEFQRRGIIKDIYDWTELVAMLNQEKADMSLINPAGSLFNNDEEVEE